MASKRSTRQERVLAQAQAVLRGEAGEDWQADWPFEWAYTLLELAGTPVAEHDFQPIGHPTC